MTTANGIRVTVNPDPWVFGVAVNLWYGVGSVAEETGKTGFAHLFEHLMFSGSAQVASGEHLGALQAIGGNANATTSFDRTNYYETIPAGGLELALWLEAERLTSLLDAVDITNLDTQRAVVLEEKRQRYDNQPYGDAFMHLMTLVYGEAHPYGHLPIGSMADLEAATLDDVAAFFSRHYVPANLVLTLSGAVTPDEGFALVEKYFGDIPPGAATPAVDLGVPRLEGLPRTQVTGDVPQDLVYCCWRTPPVADAASDALGLALTILAGSMSSRLHQELVRTSIADSVDAFDLGLERGTSVAAATAACAEGVAPERVEEALIATWERFLADGPTPAELARAKMAEERDVLADLASIESRADQISGAVTQFGDAEEVNRHLATIAALTPEAVHAAAAEWLDPAHRAVLTYRGQS